MKRLLQAAAVIALLGGAIYMLARVRHGRSQERVARRLGGLWTEPPAAEGAAPATVSAPPPVAQAEQATDAPLAPVLPPEALSAWLQSAIPAEEEDLAPAAERPKSTLGIPAADVPGARVVEELSIVTAEFLRLAAEGAEIKMEEALLDGFAESAEPAVSPDEAIKDEPTPAPVEPEPLPVEHVEAPPPTTDAPTPSPPAEVALPEALEEALSSMDQIQTHTVMSRSAEGYLDEGNVYFNVGQYALAADRYGKAIESDPSLVAAYYNRGNALTRSGDYGTALSDYDRALELQPNDADALNNRGMLHLYRASYEEALRDFDGALTLEPTDTTVMVNRGLAYLHSGRAREALVDFEAAAKIDWTDAAALYGAGQAAAQLGDRQTALRHIRQALEADPDYAREAAADPKLSLLQGDHDFVRLLRAAGAR